MVGPNLHSRATAAKVAELNGHVVLDTHVLVWWLFSPEKLSAAVLRTIESGVKLSISSASFWEIGLLIQKRRLEFETSLNEIIHVVDRLPQVNVYSIDTKIIQVADSIELHDDPADRFIAATAVVLGVPLLTKDEKLRRGKAVKTIW